MAKYTLINGKIRLQVPNSMLMAIPMFQPTQGHDLTGAPQLVLKMGGE